MNWSCMVMTMEEPMFAIHIIAATTAGTPSIIFTLLRVRTRWITSLEHLSSQFLHKLIRRPIWPSVFFKNRILLMILFLDPAVCAIILLCGYNRIKNCKEDTWKRKILFFMLGQPFCWLFRHNKSKPMSNMRLIKHQKIHQLSLQQQLHQKHRIPWAKKWELRKVFRQKIPLQQRQHLSHRLLAITSLLTRALATRLYQSNQHQLW